MKVNTCKIVHDVLLLQNWLFNDSAISFLESSHHLFAILRLFFVLLPEFHFHSSDFNWS